ncbi:hypothetical protein BHM03_00015419, partial [Ensete ventricosum]
VSFFLPPPLQKGDREAMVEHLALIFGTEKDRANCALYFKIGACRHGPRFSRHHTQPSISPTLLHSNMNQRIDNAVTPGLDSQGQPIDPSKIQEHFEVPLTIYLSSSYSSSVDLKIRIFSHLIRQDFLSLSPYMEIMQVYCLE